MCLTRLRVLAVHRSHHDDLRRRMNEVEWSPSAAGCKTRG